MFDSSKPLPELKGPVIDPDNDSPPDTGSGIDWSQYTEQQLMGILGEVMDALPPLSLAEVDVEQEVLLQYRMLRRLQEQSQSSAGIPLNQRVQLANSVGSLVQKLGEMQASVWTSERLKRIEKMLIKSIGGLPTAEKEAFLTQYRENLTQIS